MQDTRSIYKNQLYVYTIAVKTLKMKLRKTVSFTIAPKRIKQLEITLTKEAQDWYVENYNTLVKESKKT